MRVKRGTRLSFLWIAVCSIVLGGTEAQLDTLVVLHTNDFHGYISAEDDRIAGAARIGAYFKQIRTARSRVIALDAGDCVSGTPVSVLFDGKPIFEVMDRVGYDAAVLGNHEFDYGWKTIQAYRNLARFPLLSANAIAPSGDLIGDHAYRIIDAAGLRVGVVGITAERTPRMITDKGNEGIRFEREVASLADEVEVIRDSCDVLIALTHTGLRRDSLLAEQVGGLDLIVSGHEHAVLVEPRVVNDVPIVQAGSYGRFVGLVEVLFDHEADQVVKVNGSVLPAASLPPPDPEIQEVVDKWESQVADRVNVTIANSSRMIRGNEKHAFVETVLAKRSSADFAYYNQGGIRAHIPKGDVTIRRIWEMHPFGNALVVVRIQGDRIGGVLRQRLQSEGHTIEPDRMYTVATTDYATQKSRVMRHIGRPESIEALNELIRDTVIAHIRNVGVDDGGPYYQLGRLP